ncbi:hypothetical protein FQA39_LY13887 [Lamprigera yunnana]|nr:hypothetical protein FQA39_LY13887 [Lamprigera yunnana]
MKYDLLNMHDMIFTVNRCSACDSLFPSLMALEHHKEEFEHWSGDEDDEIYTDSDEDDTLTTEERERLL